MSNRDSNSDRTISRTPTCSQYAENTSLHDQVLFAQEVIDQPKSIQCCLFRRSQCRITSVGKQRALRKQFFSVSAHIVDLPWPRTHSTVYCHEYNYLLKTDKHVHINIKLQYLDDVS